MDCHASLRFARNDGKNKVAHARTRCVPHGDDGVESSWQICKICYYINRLNDNDKE